MKTYYNLLLGVLLLFCLGCTASKGIKPITLLTSNPWELSTIQGLAPDDTKFPEGLPTLYFLEGGKLSGFTGCNNFSGGFSLESGGIQLDPGAMTKKACPGSGEDEFMATLEKVKTYSLDKGKLILSDGISELMSFVAGKKE